MADEHTNALDQMTAQLMQVVTEYCRSKIQTNHIGNWNMANGAYIHKADLANKYNLANEQRLGVTPFPVQPPSISVQVNDPQATPQPQAAERPVPAPAAPATTNQPGAATVAPPSWQETAIRWLAPMALGGSLVAGGALAGRALNRQPQAPAPAAAQTADPAATTDGSVSLDVEGYGP